MRTKLLYLLFIVPFISFGQTIESETFDGLSLGSISGQGTWQSQIGNGDGSTTNMTEANLAVTTGGVASTNGFTITGPNGDSGSALSVLSYQSVAGSMMRPFHFDSGLL